MRSHLLIVLLLLPLFFVPKSAPAKDVIQIIIKKQEEKRKYRWSLAEWFRVKQQIRMQDMWLAMHSKSPYEFFFGFDYFFGSTKGGSSNDAEAWRLFAAAYARIFGLEFQKVFRNEEWSAILNMRMFGRYVQTTNLTLQFGIRSQKAPEIFRNLFAGASLTLYIAKEFGLEGIFRHYFTSLSSDSGLRTWGNRWEVIAFVDYQVFRIFGSYADESETIVSGSPTSNNNLTGFSAGIKVFF